MDLLHQGCIFSCGVLVWNYGTPARAAESVDPAQESDQLTRGDANSVTVLGFQRQGSQCCATAPRAAEPREPPFGGRGLGDRGYRSRSGARVQGTRAQSGRCAAKQRLAFRKRCVARPRAAAPQRTPLGSRARTWRGTGAHLCGKTGAAPMPPG